MSMHETHKALGKPSRLKPVNGECNYAIAQNLHREDLPFFCARCGALGISPCPERPADPDGDVQTA